VPPHLRPGYVAKTAPAAPSYTGRVHWPTNVNSHRANNVVQPEVLHAPSAATAASLGITSKKTSLKAAKPITLNLAPVARPTTRINNFPTKFRTAAIQHLKHSQSVKSTRKKAKQAKGQHHKPSKKTRRR
jgi:hypothetical protein